MAKFLKKRMNESYIRSEDLKVKRTVGKIIKEIEEGGDKAVRKYAKAFDNWLPETFRLSEDKIKKIIERIPNQVVTDILFAQQQVRFFAEQQRASIADIEVETLPGIFLGHKNIPVNSVGCYVPGGRYPMVASAHMSIVTAKVAGVKRIIACTPPINGKIPEAR